MVGSYARELGEDPAVLVRCKGSDLVGARYAPIFDYFDDEAHRAEGAAPGPNAWTIIAGDFVTTSDGTGLVHLAPAFGEDDMRNCSNCRCVRLVSDFAIWIPANIRKSWKTICSALTADFSLPSHIRINLLAPQQLQI